MNRDIQLSRTLPPPVPPEDGRPLYRNFLIVVPGRCEACKTPHILDAPVRALAHHLNQDGFAYVASAAQKEVEDDDFGVRYLPLGQQLPSFGSMAVVIVLEDHTWAARAAATYREAEVFLLAAVPEPPPS